MFSDDFHSVNYTDHCSPYEFGGTTDEIIYKLKVDTLTLIQWYRSNYLKPNPDIWHQLLSETNNSLNIEIQIEYILNSSNEKVLCVFLDNKLNFHTHVWVLGMA